jgi:hypothetical protein
MSSLLFSSFEVPFLLETGLAFGRTEVSKALLVPFLLFSNFEIPFLLETGLAAGRTEVICT